ncbi:hypothetical protein [Kitasatospora sp. NPDC005856]
MAEPYETIDPEELARIEASHAEMRAHIRSLQPTSEALPEAPETER